MKPYYFTSLGLAAFATMTIYYITKSRIGKALIATEDDEIAAEASGIYTLNTSIGLSVGAFLTGLGGTFMAYYLFHIHPAGFFNLKWALYPYLMSIMGVGLEWF